MRRETWRWSTTVQLTGTMAVPSCTDALIYAEGSGGGVDIYVDDVTLTP